MTDPALLPPPLQDARGLAFLQLCEAASAVDLAQTRISWFDLAPSAALPALAVQAGLSTDPGWLLATSDGERRALLQESLGLAKRRGTPWSIQRALALSGWPGLRFEERLPPRTLDGTWILDGIVGLDQLANWARFRVVQPLPDKPVTPEALALIVRVIEAWKPLRCHLEGIAFTLQLASSLRGGLLDGSWLLDGSRTLCGIRLEEIAEVRFGANGSSAGLAHRLAIPAVDDSQAGWVSVRFEIDALTANGEQIDSFALCTAQGAEITRITRAPITKTPGLVLDCTWVIETEGRTP
jgi:hypothetical protein